MPKVRSIDPRFWDDPEIATLTRDERLLLIGMITACADDEGRLMGDAGYLRKIVFGYDDDVTRVDVEAWRDGIVRKCRNVKLYEVGGQLYISFIHWQAYQPMRYAIKSRLPEYTEECATTPEITETSGNLPQITENFLHARGRVELSRVELDSVEPPLPPTGEDVAEANFQDFFDAFWEPYPKKIQKQAAIKAARKIAVRDRDEVIEASKHYALSSRVIRGYAKDPPGFLKDGFWQDYVAEPVIEEASPSGTRPKRSQETGAVIYMKRHGILKAE